MKWIYIIFILLTQIVISQEFNKIGVSYCTCGSNNIDSLTTLTRVNYKNGKRSSDIKINMNSKCEIEDTSTTIYDTLGRITEYYIGSNNISKYSYDSLGRYNVILTILNGKSTTVHYEYISNNNKLKTVNHYRDGHLESVTKVKKRKDVTKYTDEKRTATYQYNKDKQITRFKMIISEPKMDKIIYKTKNYFNSKGDIVKSIGTENGSKRGLVRTFYQEGIDIKEIRTFYPEKCTITTIYFFQ